MYGRALLVSIVFGVFANSPAMDARASMTEAPTGVYELDPNHFSLLFRVDHLGFSHIVGRFNDVEAELTIDPGNPEGARLAATISATSIDTNVASLDNFLRGASMLNAVEAPQIEFEMSDLVLTSEDAGTVNGRLSIAGRAQDIAFDVKLVGAGYNRFEGAYILGFAATGTLTRSDWGLTAFTPDVGDEVLFSFEGEFVYSGAQL